MVTVCALDCNIVGFFTWMWTTNCSHNFLLKWFYSIVAEIGNAISNDGDALFPAIALAPKAAIIATLYSAIPAFIFAYGYMFLFE